MTYSIPEAINASAWNKLPRYRNQRENQFEVDFLNRLQELPKRIGAVSYFYTRFLEPDVCFDVSSIARANEVLYWAKEETNRLTKCVTHGDKLFVFSNPEVMSALENLMESWVVLGEAQKEVLAFLRPVTTAKTANKITRDTANSSPGPSIDDVGFAIGVGILLCIFLSEQLRPISLWRILFCSLVVLMVLTTMLLAWEWQGSVSSGEQLFRTLAGSYRDDTRTHEMELKIKRLTDDSVVIVRDNIGSCLQTATRAQKVKAEVRAVVHSFYSQMLVSASAPSNGKVIVLTDSTSREMAKGEVTVQQLQTSETIMEEKLFTRLIRELNAQYASSCPILTTFNSKFGTNCPAFSEAVLDPSSWP